MSVKWGFSAGGIVYKKEQDGIYVLLIRVKNRWSFPKGNIERGESKEDAALREVKEETGIDGEIVDFVGEEEYWYQLHGEKIHKFVYFYLMKYKGGEIQPQKEEINEAKFVKIDEAFKLLTYDTDRNLLKKAVEILKQKGELVD